MSTLEALMTAVPEQETIYHYTSQQGLLGIIQQKSLWVSSIRHLNDSAEFAYSVELVRTILRGKLRHESGPWNGYYGAILDFLDATQDMTLFVGSFSENGDLLSQWRAYSASGVGFSVGFHHTYLQSLAVRQKFRFVKCSYNRIEHSQILNELINGAGKRVKDGDHRDALESFFVGLFKVAPALKHPSFSEEKEWRLVSEMISPSDPATRFRPGKSMLVPYGEFRLRDAENALSVSKIFIGPAPHMEHSISSVKRLLFSEGIGDCTVTASRIPFRSW